MGDPKNNLCFRNLFYPRTSNVLALFGPTKKSRAETFHVMFLS